MGCFYTACAAIRLAFHSCYISFSVARVIVTFKKQFHVARFYSNALRILQCNTIQYNGLLVNPHWGFSELIYRSE